MTREVVTAYFVDGPYNGRRLQVGTVPGGFAPPELMFAEAGVSDAEMIVALVHCYAVLRLPKNAANKFRAHCVYIYTEPSISADVQAVAA